MVPFPVNKLLLSIVAVLCAVSVVRADDTAEAKAAFDTFVLYQRTDDERTPDLFAPDVSVTLILDTGKEARDVVLPPEKFRQMVTQEIAKKQGSKDVYEDVKCVQEGDTVKVTSTILYAGSGKRGPFLAIYGRDGAGRFKIKAVKVTIPVDHLPPGS